MKKHYRISRRAHKAHIIALYLVSYIIAGVVANHAIDVVREMSETEFWAMFGGHSIVLENEPIVMPAKAHEIAQEVPDPIFDKVAKVTAYNSVPEQTDATPCISADGTNICEFDGCVVAQNGAKFGTKVEIDGIGICTVHDRKNSRYDSAWIDYYMGGREMVGAALKFGTKDLKYRVIEQ